VALVPTVADRYDLLQSSFLDGTWAMKKILITAAGLALLGLVGITS
jgi:hypothetical protein